MRPSSDYTASVLEAVRDEIDESESSTPPAIVRLGVRLNDADLAELKHRIGEIGDEFEPRDDRNGTPVGILALVYKRRP
jgi:hypothetical protein